MSEVLRDHASAVLAKYGSDMDTSVQKLIERVRRNKLAGELLAFGATELLKECLRKERTQLEAFGEISARVDPETRRAISREFSGLYGWRLSDRTVLADATEEKLSDEIDKLRVHRDGTDRRMNWLIAIKDHLKPGKTVRQSLTEERLADLQTRGESAA